MGHNVEKRKIWSHQKNISSNQLFSNFFSKSITFTEFLPKMCETKSRQFPHCVGCMIATFFVLLKDFKFSVKSTIIENSLFCLISVISWNQMFLLTVTVTLQRRFDKKALFFYISKWSKRGFSKVVLNSQMLKDLVLNSKSKFFKDVFGRALCFSKCLSRLRRQ